MEQINRGFSHRTVLKTGLLTAALLITSASGMANVHQLRWAQHAIEVAQQQLLSTATRVMATDSFPRSIWKGYDVAFIEKQLETKTDSFRRTLVPLPSASKRETLRLCNVYDWTSGFFPGSLWYAYALTNSHQLKQQAIAYTEKLNPVRYYKRTHDLGFMIDCSYGNALRFAPNDTIKDVIIETADNLAARFNEKIGCIRSWDFGKWNFPVIIDNMMNLKLLFMASKLTGDKRYYDIAVKHALTTQTHHFRPDFTTWHVVSYNDDGSVERKCTFQGKADGSAWARGQAWALYGYTECYAETRNPVFLQQAVNIAKMIMQRVTTQDHIPYWDYDAPAGKRTPRDVSAACVTASAMLELSKLVSDGKVYFNYGEALLKQLSSPRYLARSGTNEGFLLMHSVGSLPNGSEIDTPINYADYYFLEALYRYLHYKG